MKCLSIFILLEVEEEEEEEEGSMSWFVYVCVVALCTRVRHDSLWCADLLARYIYVVYFHCSRNPHKTQIPASAATSVIVAVHKYAIDAQKVVTGYVQCNDGQESVLLYHIFQCFNHAYYVSDTSITFVSNAILLLLLML